MNATTLSTATALAALTSWLCRPLIIPRWRCRIGAETERYTHLLGHQHRLTLLAVVLILVALAALLVAPMEVNPDLRDLRYADASCGQQESPYDPPTCYALEPGDVWMVEDLQPDGTRSVVARVTHPDFKQKR